MVSSKNTKKSDSKKAVSAKTAVKVDVAAKSTKLDHKKSSGKDAPISIVQNGHMVSIEYVGTLDDGSEFDSSKGHGPLQFVVGSGQVIRGFDEAIIGMKMNESKKVKIPKEKAYGDTNPQLVHKVPLSKIPDDMKQKLKVGGYLVMQSPTGHQIPARVTQLTKQEVTLDMNHPMAGKNLNFSITVKGISKASAKKDGCCGGECGCSDKEGECSDEDCKC